MGITKDKLQTMMARQSKNSLLYAIGIDTGTHTGIAVWDCKARKFAQIGTFLLHEAIFLAQQYIDKASHNNELQRLVFRVEDARQRTWFGERAQYKQQGAGSVKRDSTIWDDYLKSTGVPYVMVAPKHNATKLDAAKFKALTGYQGKTNEHNRDAAMLVFGL